MNIFFLKSELFNMLARKVEQDYPDWSVGNFSSLAELTELISQVESPSLIVNEWNNNIVELGKVCQQLRTKSSTQALSMLLVGAAQDKNALMEFLGQGVEDLLFFPLEERFFLKKLETNVRNLCDKQALLDSGKVLERYAQHIDQIANDRARQLIHSERLSTLGMMSAGIAHEMKTPIAYIGSSLEAAVIYLDQLNETISSLKPQSDQLESNCAKMTQAFGRMQHGVEKIHALTGGLKRFARQSESTRKPHSVNAIVAQALEMCESSFRYSVNLVQELKDDVALIQADSQQIEQVIVNLVINACDALEGLEHPEITITTGEDGDRVFVRVRDNGTGIPQEALESIWKPFFTTKDAERGTGLGLAISQSIIREHGGSLKAANSAEGGAVFEFQLPKFNQVSSQEDLVEQTPVN